MDEQDLYFCLKNSNNNVEIIAAAADRKVRARAYVFAFTRERAAVRGGRTRRGMPLFLEGRKSE